MDGTSGPNKSRRYMKLDTEVFPALKPIPSPDDLPADADPGSQAAADIKQNVEQADEKVAALKYLADVGCGC